MLFRTKPRPLTVLKKKVSDLQLWINFRLNYILKIANVLELLSELTVLFSLKTKNFLSPQAIKTKPAKPKPILSKKKF